MEQTYFLKKINKISSASFKLGEIMDAFTSIQLMT